MKLPEQSEWGYQEFAQSRTKNLEQSESPEDLITELCTELTKALDDSNFVLAIDRYSKNKQEIRSILQFQVTRELYDWFYNGRSGYRAQFYMGIRDGNNFNAKIIKNIKQVLITNLSKDLQVAEIEYVNPGYKYLRMMQYQADQYLQSFEEDKSKLWICEYLVVPSKKTVENILFPLMRDAETSSERLTVPRWEKLCNSNNCDDCTGLLAPYPDQDKSWLDIKGGFIKLDGSVDQDKPPIKRATDINTCGWT